MKTNKFNKLSNVFHYTKSFAIRLIIRDFSFFELFNYMANHKYYWLLCKCLKLLKRFFKMLDEFRKAPSLIDGLAYKWLVMLRQAFAILATIFNQGMDTNTDPRLVFVVKGKFISTHKFYVGENLFLTSENQRIFSDCIQLLRRGIEKLSGDLFEYWIFLASPQHGGKFQRGYEIASPFDGIFCMNFPKIRIAEDIFNSFFNVFKFCDCVFSSSNTLTRWG